MSISVTTRKRSLLEQTDQSSLSRSSRTASKRSCVGRGISKIYGDTGAFGHCLSHVTLKELSRSCSISKNWRSFIDGPNGQFLWKNASLREGVPVVEGKDRNYKEEFKFLRPITIGGKTIARYLGEIVGEVPRMRQDCFLELRDAKDFFEPAKFQRENYVVLVDPAFLKITTGPKRALKLDESGTLVEVPMAERADMATEELIVPFSFKNLITLAEHPLAGKKKGRVFHPTPLAQVLEQCNAPSDHNRIFIMRREVVADNGQIAQRTNRRWKLIKVRQNRKEGLIKVRPRGFYNAIKILETGTCPDHSKTYVRTAERIKMGYYVDNPAIGGFVPNGGLFFFFAHPFSLDYVLGVVPADSAEVLKPLELETWKN
jgi:hypothetical protein